MTAKINSDICYNCQQAEDFDVFINAVKEIAREIIV